MSTAAIKPLIDAKLLDEIDMRVGTIEAVSEVPGSDLCRSLRNPGTGCPFARAASLTPYSQGDRSLRRARVNVTHQVWRILRPHSTLELFNRHQHGGSVGHDGFRPSLHNQVRAQRGV